MQTHLPNPVTPCSFLVALLTLVPAPIIAAPAQELIQLDTSLTQALQQKQQGRLDADRYELFRTRLLGDVKMVMSKVAPTRENKDLNERILVRLGIALDMGRGHREALQTRLNKGRALYAEQDYPAALAEAEEALKLDHTNKDALALKYSSKDRVNPSDDKNVPPNKITMIEAAAKNEALPMRESRKIKVVGEAPPELAKEGVLNQPDGLLDHLWNHHPWGIGIQWLFGTRKRGWTWGENSPMTMGLNKHMGVVIVKRDIPKVADQFCRHLSSVRSGKIDYKIGSLPAFEQLKVYAADAFIFSTAGIMGGNIEAESLGSYDGVWEIKEINCCRGNGQVRFNVHDTIGAVSATRIPIIGYDYYRQSHGGWPISLMCARTRGFMADKIRAFEWNENFSFNGECSK